MHIMQQNFQGEFKIIYQNTHLLMQKKINRRELSTKTIYPVSSQHVKISCLYPLQLTVEVFFVYTNGLLKNFSICQVIISMDNCYFYTSFHHKHHHSNISQTFQIRKSSFGHLQMILQRPKNLFNQFSRLHAIESFELLLLPNHIINTLQH